MLGQEFARALRDSEGLRYKHFMRPETPRFARPILAVYVTCFAVGVIMHGLDFLTYGWRPYAWEPPIFEMFWSSRLVLDISVIVLLVLGKRRSGLSLALAIMAADVAVNAYAYFILQIPGFAVALLLQTLFLIFVLCSISYVWPRQTAET